MDKQLIQIAIDLKKNRIRVHKETLRLIGSPKYIQIMVDVDRSMLAIRATEKDSGSCAAIKVDLPNLPADFSYEIYSKSLVGKLSKAFEYLEQGCAYRLTGYTLPEQQAAVFPIDSIQPIENERSNV